MHAQGKIIRIELAANQLSTCKLMYRNGCPFHILHAIEVTDRKWTTVKINSLT